FASRNFYVEFLAALNVARNSEAYFGPLVVDTPIDYERVTLDHYVSASTLARSLGIPADVLRRTNPALRKAVWQGTKHVPKGFELRVPRGQLSLPLATLVASIPASERLRAQTRDRYHKVVRGETLSKIARRYRVSELELVRLNNLRSRHRIRIGQVLRLPDDGRTRLARPVTPQPIPNDGLYTVRRGDTLSRIAARFSVREADLISLNALRNKNRIHVGQVLRVVPDAPAPSAPAAPEPEPGVQLAAIVPAAEPAPEAEAADGAQARAAATQATEVPAEPVTVVAVAAEIPEAEPENAPTPSAETDAGGSSVADPSDYSVAADGTIEVQAAETLGHIAEWLEVRASRLRSLNGLRYGTPVQLGQRLRLDVSRVAPEAFETRRSAYHRELQEDFFARYEITGTRVHVLRRGESLWTLSKSRYKVPVWLLRQYNPDVDFAALHAGARVTVPQLRPHTAGDSSATAGAGAALQTAR
ncbi:MAG: LysM peptidoglycan-binding domain-containing protein, partial [Proteobacteria bacterium]|nr:LysM peptidoglycan-binding domain-containing protein [Pseudomonadota bacterium]